MTTTRQEYRVLSEAEQAAVLSIKQRGEDFIEALSAVAPSREISLAKTKVEEAVMWAVKGLTA